MLKVMQLSFDELSPEEQNGVSNNGSGKEYATYLKVVHDGKTILLESDAMEPEDARFYRDLAWIPKALEQVYQLGKNDARLPLSIQEALNSGDGAYRP